MSTGTPLDPTDQPPDRPDPCRHVRLLTPTEQYAAFDRGLADLTRFYRAPIGRDAAEALALDLLMRMVWDDADEVELLGHLRGMAAAWWDERGAPRTGTP